MDWKLFALTFATIFVAELGDKTQLAALAFTSDSRRPWTVFLAASLALVVVTAVGVAAGALLGRWINPAWVRRGSAVLFIAIGTWILVSELLKRE